MMRAASRRSHGHDRFNCDGGVTVFIRWDLLTVRRACGGFLTVDRADHPRMSPQIPARDSSRLPVKFRGRGIPAMRHGRTTVSTNTLYLLVFATFSGLAGFVARAVQMEFRHECNRQTGRYHRKRVR